MKQNKTEQIISAYRKLVEPFIKYPEALEVDIETDHGCLLLTPRAHYADAGKIIGKNRMNFSAVQTLMAVVAHNLGVAICVRNLAPAKVGGPEFMAPFDPHEDWPAQQTMDELKDILGLLLRHDFALHIREKDDRTTYKVTVSEKEKLPISAAQVIRELSVVFNAIGKARGRKIRVECESANAAKICDAD